VGEDRSFHIAYPESSFPGAMWGKLLIWSELLAGDCNMAQPQIKVCQLRVNTWGG
jgi:hypothetical protein